MFILYTFQGDNMSIDSLSCLLDVKTNFQVSTICSCIQTCHGKASVNLTLRVIMFQMILSLKCMHVHTFNDTHSRLYNKMCKTFFLLMYALPFFISTIITLSLLMYARLRKCNFQVMGVIYVQVYMSARNLGFLYPSR